MFRIGGRPDLRQQGLGQRSRKPVMHLALRHLGHPAAGRIVHLKAGDRVRNGGLSSGPPPTPVEPTSVQRWYRAPRTGSDRPLHRQRQDRQPEQVVRGLERFVRHVRQVDVNDYLGVHGPDPADVHHLGGTPGPVVVAQQEQQVPAGPAVPLVAEVLDPEVLDRQRRHGLAQRDRGGREASGTLRLEPARRRLGRGLVGLRDPCHGLLISPRPRRRSRRSRPAWPAAGPA